MATTSAQLAPGLGHVLVEFEYQYEGRDGSLVRIRPNERYELLSKTNSHWWQVRTGPGHKPFYIPAKYVRELPEVPTLFPEKTPAPGPAPLPAPGPAPVPVPVPVLPKTLEETRKPSDQVTIRLRPEGGYRKSENRMSTFGVPLDVDVSMVTSRSPAPRTTNGSGTANMADSHRAPAQGDSGKNSAPTARHHPIPVEMPRAPPTHDVTQETVTKTGKEEVEVGPKEDTTAKKGHKEVTTKGHQEAVTIKGEEEEEELVEEEPSESEDEREENSSHIYESIQDLNIDLDALIGRDSTAKQEVESEAPPPAQESGPGPQPKPSESPIYANVISTKKHSTIPPPPSDPAPPAPGPAPSVSGSSSSGLSPASPLSPLDGWQAHTDADSGKLFYFNPLTRKSTWTPPPDLHLDPSHAPSQCADWERLVDEVSGRFYFFNPTTGATSWALPEPQSPPSSTSRPPLPEEDYPQDHPVDDSVFTSNPPLLLPRAHLDPKPDPHRLLELPQRMMGNGVSEEGAASTRGWRHSVAEDRFYPVRRHASDLTDSSKGLAPDGTQLTERLKLKRNLSNRSTHSHQQHGHMLEKAGIINKTKVSDNGKKIRKNWSQSWTVLHGGILTFHRDPKSAPTGASSKASQIVPEFTVELRGASVSWANNKSSKKNVIELKTRQGCEYLMQYDTESIVSDWFKVISDTIRQLDWDHREHQSEDSEDSDRDDKDRKRSSRSSSGADLEQRRVRHKLRRFLQRRPTLQSVKEKGYIRDNVFGCHLDTLCHRENSSVPRFVEKCVRFVERRGLDSDGIYRVSGNLAVIQRLRHKADHEEQLDLEDGQWTEIHVVTGALKLFFRELPEPLFPFSAYDKFIAAIQLPEYSQRVSYIKDLVQTLPLPNHNTMELLFRHLRRVVEHRDQNRMSVQSLAIVFGPTLLRPQVESNLTVHMVFQSQIVELLLNEFCAVFPSSKPDSKIKLTPK